MIYVPENMLRPGMKLADDIKHTNSKITNNDLLAKDKILTDRLISKLRAFKVHGAYIDDGIKDKIEIKKFLDDNIKDEALNAIQELYEVCEQQHNILDDHNILKIENLSTDMVNKIANNKNITIGITDLQTYDQNTYYHSLSVTVLSLAIGSALNLTNDKLIELGISAMLHDIGKIDIPHDIILKPSKLTDAEFEIVKNHPLNGGNFLISSLAISDNIYKGIISHHEKYNGTGYPRGLIGEDIPLFGRIISVADVYDALTGNRPYRKPITPSEAIEYIMGGSSIIFDSKIVKAFLKKIAPYPIGMIVKLSNNKRARVIKENNLNPLRPVVKLLDESEQELDLFKDSRLINITVIGIDYNYLIQN